jgi:hypothetical protein
MLLMNLVLSLVFEAALVLHHLVNLRKPASVSLKLYN